MLMISSFLYCLLSLLGVFYLVVKYAQHQITDFYYRKTNAIAAPFPNFVFVLHSFEGKEKFCEMIEFLRHLLIGLCAARSVVTLCLFTTSGPSTWEKLGFRGSMLFRYAFIPRKGS